MVTFATRVGAAASRARRQRSGSTHARMTSEIAALVGRHATRSSVLFLGDDQGVVQLLREKDGVHTAVVYGRGRNVSTVRGPIEVVDLDLERDGFPAADGSFDVVVCNQWLMAMGEISHSIDEAWRVLAPDGLLVVSTANLSAPHNAILLMIGRQPSTIALGGLHRRGFAIHSMTRFLQGDGRFRVVAISAVGLHPFTSRVIPRALRTYSHTVVWALKKNPTQSRGHGSTGFMTA
jgi:SAM-dependent methyltransferase